MSADNGLLKPIDPTTPSLVDVLAREYGTTVDRVARVAVETYEELTAIAADSPHFDTMLISRVRRRLFHSELHGW